MPRVPSCDGNGIIKVPARLPSRLPSRPSARPSARPPHCAMRNGSCVQQPSRPDAGRAAHSSRSPRFDIATYDAKSPSLASLEPYRESVTVRTWRAEQDRRTAAARRPELQTSRLRPQTANRAGGSTNHPHGISLPLSFIDATAVRPKTSPAAVARSNHSVTHGLIAPQQMPWQPIPPQRARPQTGSGRGHCSSDRAAESKADCSTAAGMPVDAFEAFKRFERTKWDLLAPPVAFRGMQHLVYALMCVSLLERLSVRVLRGAVGQVAWLLEGGVGLTAAAAHPLSRGAARAV